MYTVTKGLDVICVRPSNPYGLAQKPFVGQGFVATAMALGLQQKPVTVYGTQGTIRDYIYIEDLIKAMFVAFDKGKSGEVYNIGSSIGRSNLDVVQAITALLKDAEIDVRIDYAPARPFDVKKNILDCKKMHSLGWCPNVGFDEGLQKTLQWLITWLK